VTNPARQRGFSLLAHPARIRQIAGRYLLRHTLAPLDRRGFFCVRLSPRLRAAPATILLAFAVRLSTDRLGRHWGVGGKRALQACLAMVIGLALSACAGRDPPPIARVQPQDGYSDCTMIRAEIEANNQKAKQLADEQGLTTAQNVLPALSA
jgi:hypothetical protein